MKMFQQRKQGIQTDHMGKGKQGIQKKIEITHENGVYFDIHRRNNQYLFQYYSISFDH